MADDSITEFTFIDVDSVHLVGTPANGVPEPLLAKSADRSTKGKRKMPKTELEKQLKKALSVDLAGTGSTSAGRLSDDELKRIIRDAQGQTRSLNDGGRAYLAAVKAFDARVTEAQAELAASRNEFEVVRAQEHLRTAMTRRLLAKMVMADNARARRQLPPGRFGPNSADLFGSTSLTLPDEEVGRGAVRYMGI